jgi:hypothetical protein
MKIDASDGLRPEQMTRLERISADQRRGWLWELGGVLHDANRVQRIAAKLALNEVCPTVVKR